MVEIIKKLLPFKESRICCVGQTAIVMGILENYETDRMKTWFINSMINMRAWFSPTSISIRFDTEFGDNELKNCPLLGQYFIPADMVKRFDLDITTVAINMIDEDRYLGFLYDRYYFKF